MLADEIKFCPRCSAGLTQADRFGRLRLVCPQCAWVYFPDPKVAVAALILRQKQILLVQRLNDPFRGCWTLPAGFVDAGEDPRLALARECLEETGLTVQVGELMDVIAGAEHARGADILIVYRAEVLSGELNPGDDAGQANFFNHDALPPLAFASTLQILNRFVMDF